MSKAPVGMEYSTRRILMTMTATMKLMILILILILMQVTLSLRSSDDELADASRLWGSRLDGRAGDGRGKGRIRHGKGC